MEGGRNVKTISQIKIEHIDSLQLLPGMAYKKEEQRRQRKASSKTSFDYEYGYACGYYDAEQQLLKGLKP